MAQDTEFGSRNEWPAISVEARPWQRSGEEVASRRLLRLSQGDYQAAVPPLIAELVISLSPDTLALADDASQELARFDAEAGLVAAPFAAILLRTESASSSEVENLTSSARELALAEIGRARSGNAQLVVANVRAMRAALELSSSINESSILAMHDALLRESAPHYVGSWRSEQVWIGGGGISPHTATFVPPHFSRVPALMADLMEFAARTDVPVLAQAALAHAQFETIHPFPDGNGRTGRALIQSMLRAGGLTRNVTVPVSAGLLSNTSSYFDALTNYRRGHPDQIVSALAEASFSAVANGRMLVNEIRDTTQRWHSVIRARSDSSVHRVTEHLVRQPVVSAKSTAEELGLSVTAAQTAIDTLTAAGILTQIGSSRRNRVWQTSEILDALDAFGARARRTQR